MPGLFLAIPYQESYFRLSNLLEVGKIDFLIIHMQGGMALEIDKKEIIPYRVVFFWDILQPEP